MIDIKRLAETVCKSTEPLVIAGPCSAETPEQVMETAKELSADGRVNLLRAGIWKPRTRPNSFEGVGAIGLSWLVDAGKEIGLPTTTEVANRHHAEAALEAGIDVLWLGARTTVNPFAVQEIADVLKGVDIPVMVKNPVNPDLALWMGAFERLSKSGINQMLAIHRGFSTYSKTRYRNVPNWELPLDFISQCPDIPMICDPSHIAGRRDLLQEVSQKAMDLNYRGLMIETHPSPDNAWSDAKQQITPAGLTTLLTALTLRKAQPDDEVKQGLEEIREKIAVLDDNLFDLLAKRMELAREVGAYKRENNITIFQQEHWSKMISQRLSKSENYGLTSKFIRQAIEAIHQESIRHQTHVMNANFEKKHLE